MTIWNLSLPWERWRTVDGGSELRDDELPWQSGGREWSERENKGLGSATVRKGDSRLNYAPMIGRKLTWDDVKVTERSWLDLARDPLPDALAGMWIIGKFPYPHTLSLSRLETMKNLKLINNEYTDTDMIHYYYYYYYYYYY